ncbi:MAG: hypothetical protein Q8N46_00470, partial [Anaerolineales bacterium]|nr:hypothetical protein [Anaerolineales bacterium]
LVHLIQKLTLARSLGHNLESGGSKADLFHVATVSDSGMVGGVMQTFLSQFGIDSTSSIGDGVGDVASLA